jgi:hypothetical protein
MVKMLESARNEQTVAMDTSFFEVEGRRMNGRLSQKPTGPLRQIIKKTLHLKVPIISAD